MEQLLELHALQIEDFGGARGLRDRGALEAAAARPAMTFGGEDLYPDVAAKAAATLVMNHPVVDGNERVGAAAAELFVEIDGYGLAAARGELAAEALAIWFRQRLVPLP